MHDRYGFSQANLGSLYARTPERPLSAEDRLVIFSDLHLGNGGRTDDFLPNADLFRRAIEEHYLPRGYTLVLNGDIEELQRFRLADILAAWREVYRALDRFSALGRLRRLAGNHDLDLLSRDDHPFVVEEAMRLAYRGDTMFVFHGHQTSAQFERHNRLVGASLRYLANPLRIRNRSVAHSSVKRFRTEERVYRFATTHRLLCIIGHTHRPLFESMSKLDSLKFEIERLCRKYPRTRARKRVKIARSIGDYRSELERVVAENPRAARAASLYSANLVVPCTFNSGTVVGRRGMTCLEIAGGEIALVHWFDERRSRKYLEYAGHRSERLDGGDYHRVDVKRDSLDYVFTRIRLLAGPSADGRGAGGVPDGVLPRSGS